MEISRALWWRFFQSRTPAFFASLSAIVLFFLALHVASNSPATSITFSPRVLSTSTSSSFYSITSTDTHQSSSTPSSRTVVSSDITLLKNISTLSDAERNENSISNRYEYLLSCDIFDGNWVIDDANPIYKPGSCPFIDDAFNCIPNGRLDSDYQRLRWQPKGCQIPRLDGKAMLETLRGKRLVFVGDSLNRNMWQSLGCILREALEDKSRMYEISGRRDFKNPGFYAFKFQDYNCTVEFVRAPFLVQESKIKDSKGAHKKTLRLDVIEESTTKYREADIIIFNSGHWWNHEKTYRGKNYYQEGDHLYPVLSVVDAYTKGLRTWARWVDDNVDSARTRVFFRGYSPSHYRGGQWNSGGSCNGETRPIKNDRYLTRYPHMMSILEWVMGEMRTPVTFLNITRMTDYRKDGHPSIFRQPSPVTDTSSSSSTNRWIQDCSHWCLPGVPDAWNQLLYTMLLTPRPYHFASDH